MYMFWWINKKNVNIFCADKTKLKKKKKKKKQKKKNKKTPYQKLYLMASAQTTLQLHFFVCAIKSLFFLLNRLSFYQSKIVHISPVYKYVLIVSHLPGSEDSDAKLDTAMILEKKRSGEEKTAPKQETSCWSVESWQVCTISYCYGNMIKWRHDIFGSFLFSLFSGFEKNHILGSQDELLYDEKCHGGRLVSTPNFTSQGLIPVRGRIQLMALCGDITVCSPLSRLGTY